MPSPTPSWPRRTASWPASSAAEPREWIPLRHWCAGRRRTRGAPDVGGAPNDPSIRVSAPSFRRRSLRRRSVVDPQAQLSRFLAGCEVRESLTSMREQSGVCSVRRVPSTSLTPVLFEGPEARPGSAHERSRRPGAIHHRARSTAGFHSIPERPWPPLTARDRSLTSPTDAPDFRRTWAQVVHRNGARSARCPGVVSAGYSASTAAAPMLRAL